MNVRSFEQNSEDKAAKNSWGWTFMEKGGDEQTNTTPMRRARFDLKLCLNFVEVPVSDKVSSHCTASH